LRLSDKPEGPDLFGEIDVFRLVRKGESEGASGGAVDGACSITVYSDWFRSTLELAWAFEVESRISKERLVSGGGFFLTSSIRAEDMTSWGEGDWVSVVSTRLRLFDSGELAGGAACEGRVVDLI